VFGDCRKQTENGCGARGCERSDVRRKLMHNGRTKNDSRQLSEVTDFVQLSDFLCGDIFDELCERFRGFRATEFLDSKTKEDFSQGSASQISRSVFP